MDAFESLSDHGSEFGCLDFSITYDDDAKAMAESSTEPVEEQYDPAARSANNLTYEVTKAPTRIGGIFLDDTTTQIPPFSAESRNAPVPLDPNLQDAREDGVKFAASFSDYPFFLLPRHEEVPTAPPLLDPFRPVGGMDGVSVLNYWMQKAGGDPSPKKPRPSKPLTKEAVRVHTMPSLSVLSSSRRSVIKIWKLWTEPWEHSGVKYPPLKLIVEIPRPQVRLAKTRAVEEQIKRVRYISVLLELLIRDNVPNPIEALNAFVQQKKWTLNYLANEIQRDFRANQLSKPNIKTTASTVLDTGIYDKAKFKCFWQGLLY